MAVSRRLALLSLGAVLLCFFFARHAVANADYDDDIHTVRHSPGADCKGEHPDKGEQCREENGSDEDDDFDDTYKIVNHIAIRLSSSGNLVKGEGEEEEEEEEDMRTSEEEVGNMFVLGH